jgi:hypothetical protein
MREFPFFDDAVHGRAWRRPDDDELPAPRRWHRQREPFEAGDEGVPGETILVDLCTPLLTAGSATRIVARFVALRFLLIAIERPRTLRRLARERAVAASYTRVLRAPPVEARALRAIVELGRFSPPRRLLAFLHDAATAARSSKHDWGAFALHREVYRIGVAKGWHAEAARAAAAIAELSAAAGAARSVVLWRRRARVLARRAEQ